MTSLAIKSEPRRVSPAAVRVLRVVAVRLLGAVGVLVGAATATFFLIQAMPGSTTDVLLARTQASPAVRAQVIAEYRLDDSLFTQFFAYLGKLATGDFGTSFVLRRPVWDAIGTQLPRTLELVAATLVLTVVASVVLAVIGAGRRRWARSLFSGVEGLIVAVPPFWLGLVLLGVFSFSLHWFPAIGSSDFSGLVLPAIALAAHPVAVVTRVLREGLLRTLDEPFVLAARARGISEVALRARHVLRHAALPVTSLLGWITGSLIGGAVIIEIVFSRQGVGRLLLSAVQNKDMPLVIGVVLLAATVFVVVNALVDAAAWLLDPRTREH
ncbi:ABC transporter permease [Actinokineospora auranticolor]|uniref:Peptide/nickel transport system permease protein n=1 Tax=Actinokineospora auranticolor TaxID=155976 RepID=A0A2S6H1X9_9PSEU|nr:ABC transporter permease [Actinokineospora auranticolor]PPK71416.1 peptide/nickel transport system permease protein [Actinokineospora auranticolor]